MVARVCIALDPPAPLRYRGQFLMLDGFGGALAEASVKGDGVQALAQAITAQLPMFWVNMQAESKAEFVPLIQSFEMMRGFLEKPAPGFGIERVLYELNPAMPCVSARYFG